MKLKANLVNEALKILNAKIGEHTGEKIYVNLWFLTFSHFSSAFYNIIS